MKKLFKFLIILSIIFIGNVYASTGFEACVNKSTVSSAFKPTNSALDVLCSNGEGLYNSFTDDEFCAEFSTAVMVQYNSNGYKCTQKDTDRCRVPGRSMYCISEKKIDEQCYTVDETPGLEQKGYVCQYNSIKCGVNRPNYCYTNPAVNDTTCPLGPQVTKDLSGALKILKIVAPILCFALSVYEVIVALTKGEADADMKKVAKRFGKRLIYTALLYFLPVLVNALMVLFDVWDTNGQCVLEEAPTQNFGSDDDQSNNVYKHSSCYYCGDNLSFSWLDDDDVRNKKVLCSSGYLKQSQIKSEYDCANALNQKTSQVYDHTWECDKTDTACQNVTPRTTKRSQNECEVEIIRSDGEKIYSKTINNTEYICERDYFSVLGGCTPSSTAGKVNCSATLNYKETYDPYGCYYCGATNSYSWLKQSYATSSNTCSSKYSKQSQIRTETDCSNAHLFYNNNVSEDYTWVCESNDNICTNYNVRVNDRSLTDCEVELIKADGNSLTSKTFKKDTYVCDQAHFTARGNCSHVDGKEKCAASIYYNDDSDALLKDISFTCALTDTSCRNDFQLRLSYVGENQCYVELIKGNGDSITTINKVLPQTLKLPKADCVRSKIITKGGCSATDCNISVYKKG